MKYQSGELIKGKGIRKDWFGLILGQNKRTQSYKVKFWSDQEDHVPTIERSQFIEKEYEKVG